MVALANLALNSPTLRLQLQSMSVESISIPSGIPADSDRRSELDRLGAHGPGAIRQRIRLGRDRLPGGSDIASRRPGR
jgi:hypothetical protein